MTNQIACRQVNQTETRVFMGTLTDGISIHAGLKEVALANKIHTATFDLLGGLHSVALIGDPAINFTSPKSVNLARKPTSSG